MTPTSTDLATKKPAEIVTRIPGRTRTVVSRDSGGVGGRILAVVLIGFPALFFAMFLLASL